MQTLLSILVIFFLVWRGLGFIAAYRRGKLAAAEREAEREQKDDWARRMQGQSKKK
ncbi:MAG: hypothetical protein K0S46_1893 [Moraxellaceae bacterium]|nr:hypothetical protein [Moraxellaceae bacterium]